MKTAITKDRVLVQNTIVSFDSQANANNMGSFRRVLANTSWNLVGIGLPLCVAVFAMPFLISRLGIERFGLLSLAWVLVGYFSLFDLGLGRALTKMVAERSERGSAEELAAVCSTGIALVSLLGLAGGLLVIAGIPIGDRWLNHLPTDLNTEARQTLIFIALGIPLVVCTAALRGILEGFQRFRLLSAIRVPAGIAMFLAPCISAWFSNRLDWAVAAVVLARLAALVAHGVPCLSLVRLSWGQVQRRWISPLLSFGGWLTVSNIISPVLVYVDRFVIGAMLSAAALGYYAAPFEVVSRLLLFPTALTAALFPALAVAHERDPFDARRLRRQASLITLAFVIPLAVIGALVSEPVLYVWLGEDFAKQGTNVMRILLVGFIFNSAAAIPFSTLHSLGHTRPTAFLHMAELPVYLIALVLLVQKYGLEGAAFAWALRTFVDWVAMTRLLNFVERKTA